MTLNAAMTGDARYVCIYVCSKFGAVPFTQLLVRAPLYHHFSIVPTAKNETRATWHYCDFVWFLFRRKYCSWSTRSCSYRGSLRRNWMTTSVWSSADASASTTTRVTATVFNGLATSSTKRHVILGVAWRDRCVYPETSSGTSYVIN